MKESGRIMTENNNFADTRIGQGADWAVVKRDLLRNSIESVHPKRELAQAAADTLNADNDSLSDEEWANAPDYVVEQLVGERAVTTVFTVEYFLPGAEPLSVETGRISESIPE